jgi:hypothetical protein
VFGRANADKMCCINIDALHWRIEGGVVYFRLALCDAAAHVLALSDCVTE